MLQHETLEVRTTDGTCPTHLFEPDKKAQHPGVVMFMDGLGIRPALFDMAARLAAGGYCVVLPDLYYRSGYVVRDTTTLFTDAATRAEWNARVMPTLSVANIMRDMPAFIALLDSRATVSKGRIATTGYCLGGKLSLAAAGHYPDRIAAAASYHGVQLATDAPDSPHLLAPAMQAHLYVGGATNDAGFDDAQKQRLEAALTESRVEHLIETYNARHGWVPADTAAHDPVAAERHWETLFALLKSLPS